MRYMSYSTGIESIDREYGIMICVLEHKARLDDEGDIIFLKQSTTNTNDFEIICRCATAVSRTVYDTVAFSIQDNMSVTGTQLYSALRMLAKRCSILWRDGRPEDAPTGGGK